MPTAQAQTAPSPTSSLVVETLVPVDPARIAEIFGVVQPFFERLVQRSDNRYSMPGLLKLITSGEWLLWLVWDGSVVRAIVATELYFDVAGNKRCAIKFCTGRDAERWVHLLGQIEAYARTEGCTRLDMTARKGWARKLKDYRMTHVLLEKELV